ncbi:WD40 repeat-like protein [Nadsonia fulvescens var. elongata DSM 6958]|uniref:WD40 repeat-like protein n=1 Tax=Nadsonia fulvescens var. elongata DSM 6958 TaxID=857566 RepID=A0A1E3PIW7_9ASCO|nr:WD40 repeat-like protein [Nadsonia fulvescens var. elongata DSM 6958]
MGTGTVNGPVQFIPFCILNGHTGSVNRVKFSPDCRFLASGSSDATIRIWSTIDWRLVNILEGHTSGISDIDWSPNSELLASAADDRTVRIWSPLSLSSQARSPLRRTLNRHTHHVTSLRFNRRGNLIVTGSRDENIIIWDYKHAKDLKTLTAHSDPISAVDFSRDGTIIVSGSQDGLIRLWDTGSGQCLKTLVPTNLAKGYQKNPVMFVQFVPNGKYIISSTLDGYIRLWDYMNDKVIKTYRGHVNTKYSSTPSLLNVTTSLSTETSAPSTPTTHTSVANVSTTTSYLIQPSEDGFIYVFDLQTKKVVTQVKAHTDVVLATDVDAENRYMASCGLDGTVSVFKISS